LQHGRDNKFWLTERRGGTTEADEVLIPKRDKWADAKRLTGSNFELNSLDDWKPVEL